MRRRWWIMAAGLVVVIIAAVILTVVLGRSEKTTAPETTSTGAATIGKYGFPVSPIRVGEGGRELAPDGNTRIGYGPSCDDAALAVLNYMPSLSRDAGPNGVAATSALVWEESTYREAQARADEASAKANAGTGIATTTKDPGLFKIGWCEPGKAAEIFFTAATKAGGEKHDQSSLRMFSQSVVFQNNTWVLSAESPEGAPLLQPGETVMSPDGKKFVGVTPEVINRLFTDENGNSISRDGWMEVANAGQ